MNIFVLIVICLTSTTATVQPNMWS